MSELAKEIGVKSAYEVLGLPRSRAYPKLKITPKSRKKPIFSLSDDQRSAIREVLNSPRFMDKSPRQVYASLLDEAVYLCHWRTMYRILHEHYEVKERRLQRKHPVYLKPELLATAANQVWSWDITTLRGLMRGAYYKLYTVLDIFSRYVVLWAIRGKFIWRLPSNPLGEKPLTHSAQSA